MPRLSFLNACLLFCAVALAGAAQAAEPAAGADGPIRNPAGVKGHAVHEWGVTMKVRFPDGRPVIWWPASEEGAGIKPPGQEVTDSLSWRLFLGRQPDGRGPFSAQPRTPTGRLHHMSWADKDFEQVVFVPSG